MTFDVGLGGKLVLAGVGQGAWLALAAGTIALIVCALIYRYERKLVSVRAGLGLLVLRLAAVLLLIAVLFEPISAIVRTESKKGRLVVGVDLSESMSSKDPGRDPAKATKLANVLGLKPNESISELSRGEIIKRLLEGDWFKAISASHSIELIGFARDSAHGEAATFADRLASVHDSNDPQTLSTDWSGVLTEAVKPSEAPLSGVVIVSDGRRNAGENIPTSLSGSKFPVHSLLVGSTDAPRDLAISFVRAPEQMYKDDKARIEAALKLDGAAGEKVQVVLRRPGSQNLTQTIAAASASDRPVVAFNVPLEDAGLQNFRVSVESIKGEARTDNNERSFSIEVVDEKSKVLLVDSEARWEFRYLRNALARDEHVEVDSVVFHQPSSNVLSNTYSTRLPDFVEPTSMKSSPKTTGKDGSGQTTQTDPLGRYDLIVLCDLDAADWTGSVASRMEKFAAETGGTLVVSGASRTLQASGSVGQTLRNLLPVVETAALLVDSAKLDEKRPSLPAGLVIDPNIQVLGNEGSWPMLRIDENADFSTDRSVTREFWKNLPRQPFVQAGKIKPGSTELALATGADGKTGSVMAAQNYGLGKVLWIGIEGTWRWRYRAGDKIHHRFWGQVVRWASTDKPPAGNRFVRFGPTKSRIPEGGRARIQARFAEGVEPTSAALLAATVVSEAADEGSGVSNAPISELAILKPVVGRPGVYEAETKPLPRGKYNVVLEAPALAERLGSAKIEAPLEATAVETSEKVELAASALDLEQLANRTGGRVWNDCDAFELAKSLQSSVQKTTKVEETTLWDQPQALLLFILLVTIEWVWRKRLGLP